MAKPPVTLAIDPVSLRNFDKALREYHRVSRKSVPEVLNRTALNLAFWASYFCQKGPDRAAEIKAGMDNPYAVLNWKYTQRGWAHPKRNEIDRALRTFLAGRAASSGYIARGWARAGRIIKERAGLSAPFRLTKKMSREGKGRAILAKEAVRSFCEITNYATTKSPSSTAALYQFGDTAMKQAITFKVSDMYVYINRKLKEAAERFNRK